jgi:hypothetical protein
MKKPESKVEMLRQISRQNKLLAREKEMRHQRDRQHVERVAALSRRISELVDEGLQDQYKIVKLQSRRDELLATVEFQQEQIDRLRRRLPYRLWVAVNTWVADLRMAVDARVALFWDRMRVHRLSVDRRVAMDDAGLWEIPRDRYRAARQYWNHDRRRLRGYCEDVMPGFWRRVLIVLGKA